jgi:ribose 5-phosphate isomerase A
MTEVDAWKRQAGEAAANLVESGMIVGLGTGSTAIWAVRRLAERLRAGELRDVVGVPTSSRTERDARALGIPLLDGGDTAFAVDLTIDGADEVDDTLGLVKGAGGALLREKIVAQASRRVVIVIDETKRSPRLGTRAHVPVEVTRFGWRTHIAWLEGLGARGVVPREGFVTDEQHLLVDCDFGPIADPVLLARTLDGRAGVVDHGLFVDFATELIVAGSSGVRRVVR